MTVFDSRKDEKEKIFQKISSLAQKLVKIQKSFTNSAIDTAKLSFGDAFVNNDIYNNSKRYQSDDVFGLQIMSKNSAFKPIVK